LIQENLNNFIDNASIGIHTVSAEGIIEYANPFELNMLGYNKSEYVGHHISEFQMDKNTLDDMLTRLNGFEILKNYPSKVQAKHSIIYVLYNSSVFFENEQFIHTRCFGNEIEKHIFDFYTKNSPYLRLS